MTPVPRDEHIRDFVRDELRVFRNEVRQDYVTKESFVPVRNVVYGFVALILGGLVTALLALLQHGSHVVGP